MADKQSDEYEDIAFDNKDADGVNDEESEEQDVSDEQNELQSLAVQLSKDYANYFKFDITQEKKETEEAIENLLTHLEEFCGLIEMIRNDSNICLEEAINNISQKSETMNEIYGKIDRLEEFVGVVKQCVDNMDKEVTKAEQLFGDTNNNRVKKFFSVFISNTSKQTNRKQIDAKYEPTEIFQTNHFIKSLDLATIPQNSDQLISDPSSQPPGVSTNS